jgi:AbrB family looped-hinge helix DNA binding protein
MSARSKLTAQAQVSVPAAIRRALGIGPGSVIAWEADGDRIVVRRVGRHSSEEIHQAVFGSKAPRKRTDRELKSGVAAYLAARHARR